LTRHNFSSFLVRPAFAGTVLCLVGALSGCAGEKPFGNINGQVVSKDEYIKALERQTVVVPGGQTTNAERLVLDQLVGNKVILAEAGKESAVPSDDEINRFYDTQKKLFEAKYPGKSYEDSMKEQGTTTEEIKTDMKVQLAETGLYAKRLSIADADVRKAYDEASARNSIGLPARVQLRLIVVAPNSPDFANVQKLLASKTDFNEVAKQVNPMQLKATAGLLPEATPINRIGVEYQAKVQQSAEGVWFGPVDFRLAQNAPAAKAWVKVEKRLPALNIPYDDAAPLIRRELVQVKLQNPANAKVRDAIMGLKVNAKFEPTDPKYSSVWEGLKKTAKDAGIGKSGSEAVSGEAPSMLGAPTAPAAPAAK
jgi:hypothetical protein